MTRARELAELGSVYDNGALSNRRLTINGDMSVAQRGSVPGLQTGYGACDRFKLQSTSAARFDTSQSTDVPSGQGFTNSLKLDCSTADTSLASGDYYFIMHQIEGLNLQHLKYGTSDAVQCTLSFWVKSPKTGIHNVEIEHVDGGKFNTHQYTIASANTWQKVSFTFDGNTAASIVNDGTVGMLVTWWLQAGSAFTSGTHTSGWFTGNSNRAVGQVNVTDSTSNDFYLTGVQLEVGSEATPFEHRSFSDELTQCQRYYNRSYPYGVATGAVDNDTPIHHMSRGGSYNIIGQFFHPRDMRAAPTIVLYNPLNGTVNQLKGDSSSYANAAVLKNTAKGAVMFVNGTTITETVFISVHATFDAEL